MSNRNIQMKKRAGEKWENLYPITTTKNVLDEDGQPIIDSLTKRSEVVISSNAPKEADIWFEVSE